LLIPVVSVALFFGADAMSSKNATQNNSAPAASVDQASKKETERVRDIAKNGPKAENSQGQSAKMIAWVMSAINGAKDNRETKRKARRSAKGGFNFAKCDNLGQAKRCRPK